MLDRITYRYANVRYRLLFIIPLFFMVLGTMVGSFEECVPLVPIVVSLAVKLGWDKLTGICMSLLAVGCGFAAGVCNPFTVGVAQQLAGLPMFSGAWLSLDSFKSTSEVRTIYYLGVSRLPRLDERENSQYIRCNNHIVGHKLLGSFVNDRLSSLKNFYETFIVLCLRYTDRKCSRPYKVCSRICVVS